MKTADEMFQEIGYQRVNEDSDYSIEYESPQRKTRISVYWNGMSVEILYKGEPICFVSDEIYAVAKLLEEMEAQDVLD